MTDFGQTKTVLETVANEERKAMHGEIHQTLSPLNGAASHTQSTLEGHGKDEALAPQLNALESALQKLWEAAETKEEPARQPA